ncbi:Substrate-binding region of ABC-type glycine betaine transport system (plasmid) [Rhizobium leguminosarum bv. trifolii WSM2304]|uniref:Substrate-binding region of ABC-type glycine betaine transport system n=1 Tax=Rhizobium leguminosarum bv. trifolii (strain WSM2304) TaxID=395492 RepID=A0ABF7QYZ2_RHILW|nr:glycine betaine/L-proline ABC transporter substrate-binding protein ProX [Rhizobium leguminosarum]ACI59528.1 Substrate-binding region of ABC-type glycine betaine transport system [Rhizobium leguminosarum bv. trifolii WSM2304]
MKVVWKAVVAAACLTFSVYGQAGAAELPGQGVTVRPIKGTPANTWFQHLIVQMGLEKLGYTVADTQEADFPAVHLAVGAGDADYTAGNWTPLHDAFYEKSGGDSTMTRVHAIITGTTEGYYVDKKTAEANHLTNIDQLKTPEIAKLFDTDGDGKANLAGCNPGWGCEASIEKHLDTFHLRGSVQHDQGSYFAIMADVISRYKQGSPILYYTWTPNWIADALIEGRDVVRLQVPSTPGSKTKSADGTDYGFISSDVYIVANNEFLSKNPVAKKFFEMVNIPIADVNAAQIPLSKGNVKVEDVRKQAEAWVAAHQTDFDNWVDQAKKAAE